MIVSIEFTSEFIYLAETNTNGKTIKVGTFLKVPMLDGAYANGVVVNTAATASAVMSAMKEHRMHVKKALVIIGGTDIIHKELSVPQGSAKQTKEMVEHELERLGLIRQEYTFDYSIRGGGKELEASNIKEERMQNIHVCLVPKALVQNYTATIRRAGLVPYQMELVNAGMERLSKILYLDKEEKMTILCCAERDQVSFLFTGRDMKPVYRLVQIRQDSAIEENAFIVSAVQALTLSNDPAEKVLDSIVENVSKLVQFRLQTGEGASVGRLLLYGSMAKEDEFLSRIEAASGIETRRCPLPDCVEQGNTEKAFNFLNIIGANAGMLHSVGELKRIDFFKITSGKKKRPVTRKDLIPLAAGLIIVCCATIYYPIISAQNAKLETQIEDDKAYMQQPEKKKIYAERLEIQQATNAVREYNEICDKYIESIQGARRLTAEDLRKISGLAGESVQITGYSFDTGILSVNCETAFSQGASSFAKSLTDAAYFQNIVYEGFKESKDKSGQTIYSFRIDCVLWEEAGAQS